MFLFPLIIVGLSLVAAVNLAKCIDEKLPKYKDGNLHNLYKD